MTIKHFDIGREYVSNTGVPAITEQPGGKYVLRSDYEACVAHNEMLLARLRRTDAQLEAIGAGGVSPLIGSAQQFADSVFDGADALDGTFIDEGTKSASAAQEPIAWVSRTAFNRLCQGRPVSPSITDRGGDVPIYAGPQTPTSVPDQLQNSPQNIPEIITGAPDGWKLVPVVPTETMVVYGFESAPDRHFSPREEWEQYEEMSGCQQAAYRAEKCWAAMLEAAPTPPVDGQPITRNSAMVENQELTAQQDADKMDALPAYFLCRHAEGGKIGTECPDTAEELRECGWIPTLLYTVPQPPKTGACVAPINNKPACGVQNAECERQPDAITYNPIYGTVETGRHPSKGIIYIPADSVTTQAAPALVGDDRAEFEALIRERNNLADGVDIQKFHDGTYASPTRQKQWEFWQASSKRAKPAGEDARDAARWRKAVEKWSVLKVEVFPGGTLTHPQAIPWETLTMQVDAVMQREGQT